MRCTDVTLHNKEPSHLRVIINLTCVKVPNVLLKEFVEI